ncbi:hypothetical protein C8F01DRAFT_1373392 [Mycena amicta]|nr:hypothetical protein C8F01DRAFT_1373392 [Mycena amicta]
MSTRSRRRTPHARRILLAVLLIPIVIYFFSSGPHSILPPSLSRTFDVLLEWLGTHCLRIFAGTALLTTIFLMYGLVRTAFMLCSRRSGRKTVGEGETNTEKASAPSIKEQSLEDEARTLLAVEDGAISSLHVPTPIYQLPPVIELPLPSFLLLLTLCTSYLLLDLWLFDVIHRDRFDESLAQNLLAVATHEIRGVLDVCAVAAGCTAFICCSRRGRRGKTVPMEGLGVRLGQQTVDMDAEEQTIQGKVRDFDACQFDDGTPIGVATPVVVSPESIV